MEEEAQSTAVQTPAQEVAATSSGDSPEPEPENLYYRSLMEEEQAATPPQDTVEPKIPDAPAFQNEPPAAVSAPVITDTDPFGLANEPEPASAETTSPESVHGAMNEVPEAPFSELTADELFGADAEPLPMQAPSAEPSNIEENVSSESVAETDPFGLESSSDVAAMLSADEPTELEVEPSVAPETPAATPSETKTESTAS